MFLENGRLVSPVPFFDLVLGLASSGGGGGGGREAERRELTLLFF